MAGKAVFFDIDGTIWDRHNFIPDSTREAIKALRDNGNYAFINTGRTRAYITNPDLLSLGFDGIVSGCGTMVEYKGDALFVNELDNKVIEKAINLMREFGMKPIIEGIDYLYMEERDFADDPYGRKLIKELGDLRQSIDAHWGNWRGLKISCEMAGCDYNKCFEMLRDDFTPLIHNPHVAEVVPKGFSKGIGIKKACEVIGVPLTDTVAIGDSVNDLEMLKTAQISIAMGGASDMITSVASFTTKPLHEDGIAFALEHYGLI